MCLECPISFLERSICAWGARVAVSRQKSSKVVVVVAQTFSNSRPGSLSMFPAIIHVGDWLEGEDTLLGRFGERSQANPE